MIRQLGKQDLAAILTLVDENKTFQRQPKSEQLNNYLLGFIRRRCGLENHLFFGDIDEQGDLLSWIHFELWDPRDEPAFFQGMRCTTNSKPVKKAVIEKRFVSQTGLDLVAHSYAHIAQLGLKAGYCVAPYDPDWTPSYMVRYSDAGKHWAIQRFEIVKAGEQSVHPLLNKYIFRVRWPGPQVVSRLSRKEHTEASNSTLPTHIVSQAQPR